MKIEKKLTFLIQAEAFLCFQATCSSATCSSESDRYPTRSTVFDFGDLTGTTMPTRVSRRPVVLYSDPRECFLCAGIRKPAKIEVPAQLLFKLGLHL